MHIVFLDAGTLGKDLDLSRFERLGRVTIWQTTSTAEVASRIIDADIIIVNKIKLFSENLHQAKKLKLITLVATGYDNIDLAYCRDRHIAVCNVVGYSTHSVAQLTFAMALSLSTHLRPYEDFVRQGAYTQSGLANYLSPIYHELYGKTWGVWGYGNIGKQVAHIARAFGCRVVFARQTPSSDSDCLSPEDICRTSDILSIHTPLSPQTHHMLNKKRITLLKPNAIVINVARGGVWDESAIAEAILNKKIAGIGCDVYTTEPFSQDHPFWQIKHLDNVALTPHMAWGAYEARERCLAEVEQNILSFLAGEQRCRVEL